MYLYLHVRFSSYVGPEQQDDRLNLFDTSYRGPKLCDATLRRLQSNTNQLVVHRKGLRHLQWPYVHLVQGVPTAS